MHDSPLETRTWMVGIDSWVIQDGSYADFETGQRADFALEFASRSGLRLLDREHEASVRWLAGSEYEVTAKVVHDRASPRSSTSGSSPTTSSASRTRGTARRSAPG